MPTFYLIVLAFHAYVGWRLIPALQLGPVTSAVAIAVLVTSALSIPTALRLRRAESRNTALTWGSLLLMGWSASLTVATLIRDALLAIGGVADRVSPGLFDPTLWSRDSALLVVIASVVASVVGLINARRTARVVAVDVPIEHLPADLAGYRIAQLSDIHVGPTIRRDYLDAIVDRVNELNPDAIAITGDLVDGSVEELAWHVAPLARLKARDGVYFVTGNHEYYSGAPGWVAELRRLGITVLENQHVVVGAGSSRLVIAGVNDFGAHHFNEAWRSDAQAAVRGAREHDIKVLLAHQPRSADAALRAGFDLQLSGHTHGGQFFPWNFFVRLQQPFTAGLNRLGRLWVYTSRGTGYWGPPKRLFAPSEITDVRLVAAA